MVHTTAEKRPFCLPDAYMCVYVNFFGEKSSHANVRLNFERRKGKIRKGKREKMRVWERGGEKG